MHGGGPAHRSRVGDQRGRVALVCGATGWIGKAVAGRLLADGASVAVHGHRDAQRTAAVAAGLGPAAHPVTADLRDPAAVDRVFAEVRDRLGALDVVVNAAYPPAPDRLVRDSTVADSEAHHAALVMHLNVCRRAVRDMEPRGYGRIVLVSAAMAARPFPGTALYGATAAALTAFSRTLALEVGSAGITVNVVAPGRVDDGGAAPEDGDSPYGALDRISRQRAALPALPTPTDVADLVAYLASPGAGAVTGQVVYLASGEPIGA